MSVTAPDLPVPVALGSPPGPEPGSAAEEASEFDAVEVVARPHFHQRLTLPATDTHGELTVTYAVAGKQDDSAPTVLLIGGMFGGRYMAAFGDYISEKLGVRLVAADRPGMGGSTRVPQSQRISVWLETVPVLMRAVGATYVSLVSHSCGVIYALNTLYAMPHILRPENPALYLFAPWVPPEHSGVKLTSVASMLPSGLISQFDNVIGFIQGRLAQPIGMSSTVLSAIATPISEGLSSWFVSEQERQRKEEVEAQRVSDLTARLKEYSGCDVAGITAFGNEIMRRAFEEDTTGGSDDCLLCLRKPSAGPWGECDSYEGFPERLDKKLREQFWKDRDQSTKVLIKALWAETDILVGKGGEAYFDKCFKGFAEATETCLVYRSESVPKTDHDDVFLPFKVALPKALRDIVGEASVL